MLGLMQDWPLLCHRIIDHAATIMASARSSPARSKGRSQTTNYAEIRARALKVAQRLEKDGIKLGDRVATLAWNTWRHLEAWYGILGIGAIYHTVNPRLFPEQIGWIINHAEDRVMITDLTFVPLLEKNRRQAADHRALHRPHRRRAHAEDDAEERRRLRGMDRRSRRRFRLEDRSTKIPRPACATPPAPPAIPRACSIRTAPTCCTPSWRRCRTAKGLVVARRRACRWCRCSTPTAGRWRFSTPMVGATLVMPGAEARRRLDLRAARHLQGDVHRGGADGVADAAAGSGKDRRQAAASQARGDRRLRLPARHDARHSRTNTASRSSTPGA